MKLFGYLLIILINIYLWLLIIRLLFFLTKTPYLKQFKILYKITDPVLEFFRKNFPIKYKNLDFSPLIPLIILSLLILPVKEIMIDGASFGLFYIFRLIIEIVDMIFIISIICFITFIIILLFINISDIKINNSLIDLSRYLINPLVNFLSKIIKIDNNYSERIYLLIILIIFIIIGIIGHNFLIYIRDVFSQIEVNLYKKTSPDIGIDIK